MQKIKLYVIIAYKETKKMKCKLCSKEFQSYLELTTHLVKEHGYAAEDLYEYYEYSFKTKEAICPVCGNKFIIGWRQLKKHEDGTGKGITCGRSCASKFMNLVYGNPSCREDVKEKKRQKALEKYGVENVFQAKEIKEKLKQTNLEKYGVEYPMQSKEIKQKSKETNVEKYGVEHVSQRQDIKEQKVKKSIEKYGVENISQAQEVKDKKKEASLERYGVECTLQAPEVREKIRETNIERYGVENVFQNKEIQEKVRSTNLDRYGVEYVSQSPEIQEKVKQTCLERYGVEYALASEEVKAKIKEACIEHFGVESPFQSPEVQKKIRETNLEKYGVEYASQSPETKEKIKQTNLKKYGVEYTFQSEKLREKGKETCINKYGVDHPMKSSEIKKKVVQTNLERYGIESGSQTQEARDKRKRTVMSKYGVPHIFMSEEIKEKMKEHVFEKYGVNYFCQHKKCIDANVHRISQINKKFQKLLRANRIESELEFIIEDYGYDLKVGNTLVEIDPYFTHNSTLGPCFGGKEGEPKSFDYHYAKTMFAKEHGFDCVHIFDWDDKDKVVSLFKEKETIYARKCEVKEISKKEAREFLDDFHLQGSTKQLQYAYGLFYEDELVQVMTFGKPRYNKKYEYELLRLCTKSSYKVIGGASKILKYFEEQVNPESILSYCDLSKFNGGVYEELGFRLINQTSPARHWYNYKTKRHITDNLLRQRGFDQLHKASFGKGTSNEELMREHGYVEIYDCGQLVFAKEIRA